MKAASFLFIAILLSAGPLQSQDSAEAEGNWMMDYYLDPTPEELPSHLIQLSEDGVLSDPKAQAPIVGFTSQVMANHPDRVGDWMAQLSDLPEDSAVAVQTALWFSNTEASREYFEENDLNEYLEAPAPDILGMAIDNPGTLDLLWGYFFATGEKAPIESLVSSLALAQYAGALNAYPESEKTETDREAAYFDATFQSALWSLESNAVAHPRVLQYCQEILAEGDLTEREQLWLKVVLSKAQKQLTPGPLPDEPDAEKAETPEKEDL
ncbi:hypothetical protein [Puniceicoccus vermicola]|uniref:HEAT repeat domain-containing protein n=1 Tax=Puniceicoccus vermicola TaxID=388746 RepID=A0A7X1E2I8_9BACT|nr:hypothetical protein [Puniceicoccus vermicola]MBC2600515.1 hypothetical protein [Puniceicoccus vermicola]